MKPLTLGFILLTLSWSLTNCSPAHERNSLEGQQQSLALNSAQSVLIYERTLYPIIQTNCATCHGVNRKPKFAVVDILASHNSLLENHLVDLSTPTNSKIIAKIQSGHGQLPRELATDLKLALVSWASELDSLNGIENPEITENPKTLEAPKTADTQKLPDVVSSEVLQAKFASIHKQILIPRCAGCHNPDGEKPSVDYSSYETTLSTGKVVPGNSEKSKLYTECKSGWMPQFETSLNDDELTAIQTWINEGAQNN